MWLFFWGISSSPHVTGGKHSLSLSSTVFHYPLARRAAGGKNGRSSYWGKFLMRQCMMRDKLLMSWTTVLGVLPAKWTHSYTCKYSEMRHFGSLNLIKQGLPPLLCKEPQDKMGMVHRCLFWFVLDIHLGECFAYFAYNYMPVRGESHSFILWASICG